MTWNAMRLAVMQAYRKEAQRWENVLRLVRVLPVGMTVSSSGPFLPVFRLEKDDFTLTVFVHIFEDAPYSVYLNQLTEWKARDIYACDRLGLSDALDVVLRCLETMGIEPERREGIREQKGLLGNI